MTVIFVRLLTQRFDEIRFLKKSCSPVSKDSGLFYLIWMAISVASSSNRSL